MKRILSVILLAVMLFCLCSCDTGAEAVSVYTLKGPTGMGMSYLMENMQKDYSVTLANAPDDIVGAFTSNEAAIAAVPINLAATLSKKLDGDVSMLAINTLGVLYILEQGNTINSINDLSGKTLYATGQGSTPEYVLSYLLEKNGITDCTIEYKTEHSELATLMASGEVTLGMLPEPNVTATMLKNKNLRIALDLTEEWAKVSDTELVQGCIITRTSYLTSHLPVITQFLADYKTSTDYVNNNVDAAAELIAKHEIIASSAAAKAAIPNCNIVMITGEDMAAAANGMYNVLFSIDKKSIGGALPTSDTFYYIP